MRIATFNVQNLRLRRLGRGLRLDGARDCDDNVNNAESGGVAADLADRELTADVIVRAKADIVGLQEVYDQATLDHFHDRFLTPRGALYPHRVCLEGNDGRSVDVALLSRYPLRSVTSHAKLVYRDIGVAPPYGTSPTARVFRRDCLEVEVENIHLFVCHLKAGAAGDDGSRVIRRAEAAAVRQIIERGVGRVSEDCWLVVGDFNAHDAASEADLAPLTGALAVDFCARIPKEECWTYYQPDLKRYSCPDRILASASLAAALPGARPEIFRSGMGWCAEAYVGHRFQGVGRVRPHASDHALLAIEVDI